jgi:imidazolonepropionase-like amidohydrolase
MNLLTLLLLTPLVGFAGPRPPGLLVGFPGPRPPGPPPEAVAFVHATVLPMDAPRALPGHTVIVTDGRIAWLGLDAEAVIPPGTLVIDARGGVLLPGLVDMHVHASADDFGAFLANGVTTIREMNGTPEHLGWREEIAAGRLPGPTLVVTGPLIAGQEQRWRHVLARTPEEAEALVREHARSGYDAVKVYDGLTEEAYAALAATARELNILFVGHVPEAVGLDGVLSARQTGIEHAASILHGAFREEPDSTQLREVAARIASAGTWVTPTLASHEALALVASESYAERLDRPETGVVDAGTVEWWRSLVRTPDSVRTAERLRRFEFQRSLTQVLHEAGVPLLAGTDTPNPLMVPGYSLHHELRNLVDAGLTPYQAIVTATVAPAQFLGQVGTFGVITAGARADLILVEGDPLTNLETLEHPVGVMVRGEWLPRERLAELVGGSPSRP